MSVSITSNPVLRAGIVLLTGLGMAAVIAEPESTDSDLISSENTNSRLETFSPAKSWALTATEWTRYQTLMKGIRGSLSLPTISPIEVLGIHARNDAERRRYAEQWARLMYQDAGRVLAFQRAYDEAVKRLFSDQPLIDPVKLPVNGDNEDQLTKPPAFEAGDRLMFFTPLNCSRCDTQLPRLLNRLDQGPSDRGIDIYLIDPDTGEEPTDAEIRDWATAQALPVDRVRNGTLTLNHNQGTWFQITGRPLPDTWPAIIHRRQDQFVPWPLSAVGWRPMMSRLWMAGIVLVVLGSGFLPCQAEPTIPPAYVEVARAFEIPPRILYAVAWTESGLRLTSKQIRPWPWTLNVQGRGERYASREAAWQAIQAHRAAGRHSIDIGLMQINWRWHSKTLGDPREALDPMYNLRAGARLLRDLYRESGDWSVAIGRYHAPAPTHKARARAKAYRARVHQRLAQLEKSP